MLLSSLGHCPSGRPDWLQAQGSSSSQATMALPAGHRSGWWCLLQSDPGGPAGVPCTQGGDHGCFSTVLCKFSALPWWENIHRMTATQQPGGCFLSKGLAPNNTFLPPGEGFCPTEAGQEPEGQFLCFAKTGTWAYATLNPSGKCRAGKVHTVETKRNDLAYGGRRMGNQIRNKTPLQRIQQKSPPSIPSFPM